MNRPLVSVLINNYNYGRFLPEAIASALKQTYPHIEVIVVDDGSTDNSRQVIEQFGNQIQAVLKENGGQASAFNAGFAASQGEILCFLDADDWFLPEKVGAVVEVFTQYPDIGWYFHALQLLNVETQASIVNSQPGISGRYDLTPHVKRGKLAGKLPVTGVATSGLCFRRSFLQTLLPMPEAIRITSDDYLKYLAFGLIPGYVSINECAVQRIHANNAYTFRADKQLLRANIHLLTAYWMRQNFPVLTTFANNLFAAGLSHYWQVNQAEPTCQKLIQQYLAPTPRIAALEIYLRATYYRLKTIA